MNDGGSVSLPSHDVHVSRQEEYQLSQEYHLTEPEERRALLSVLIERRAIIRAIEISIDEETF